MMMMMMMVNSLQPRWRETRRLVPRVALIKPTSWSKTVSRCLSTTTTTKQHDPVVTIGILRETYGPWERRSPLTPQHVREILQKHNVDAHNEKTGGGGVRILVQPCQRRVFSGSEYEQAGATLTNDLTEAGLILGVKRPADTGMLLPNKTYMFFSHTIKGQPENMPLLQACLDEHIQLMDYERLLDESSAASVVGGGGGEESSSKPKRLVSFGRFAGLAGAIDTLHGLGRRLLAEGQSTPLLSCPPAVLCDDLAQAQERLHQIGQRITNQGLHRQEPLVISVTGKGGSVYGGVAEMLELLPHEIVPPDDLQYLFQSEMTETAQHQLYLTPLATKDAFAKTSDGSFDRMDFQNNPSQYSSTLPDKVVKYSTALINCAYWDPRFPRLLTKDEMRRLYNVGSKRLRMVSDISCDVKGSIEFLERSTTIDKPFFQYDPLMESEVADTITESGITVLGVDILPTELPLEASQHFGNKLLGVIDELIDVKKRNYEAHGFPVQALSNGVAYSAITNAEGRLTTRYRYLQQLLKNANEKKADRLDCPLLALRLEGHVFDTGLINQVLDTIEEHRFTVHLDDFVLPRHRPHSRIKSSLLLTIVDKEDRADRVGELEAELQSLVAACKAAEATMTRVDPKLKGKATTIEGPPVPKALVLGSGFVARSAIESLSRSNVQVTLVSNDQAEAARLASTFENVDYVVLDVHEHEKRLLNLIRSASVVVSLLPAPMHPFVANLCLAEKTHFVSSSYESAELRAMNDRMKEAGIICLNEVGLDPGLDHMSSMRIIDDIHERGGEVVSFSSVCGGLPSPEAANNPFGYKFSWSPRGVLRASVSPARYLLDDKVVEIQGGDLLSSSRPFPEGWPEMKLECLPNRDSIKYADIYGISATQSIFRGTLRYHGFCTLLRTLRNMGLLDEVFNTEGTWYKTMLGLCHRRGFKHLEDFALACADEKVDEAARALEALRWLGMLKENPITSTRNDLAVIDAFCHTLEENLRYQKDEKDMVLMHHHIQAMFADGSTESHVATLDVRGTESHSAMSQTVGFTCAAAVQFVLSHPQERGLLLPIRPFIYQPILDAVAKHGIRFHETVDRYPVRRALRAEQRA